MNKKHKGYNGELYDSRAEADASFKFAKLGCIPCKEVFPQTFTDASGTKFRACPDFYHAGAGLYIEFKTYKLNGTQTKTSSEQQLTDKEIWRQSRGETLSLFDRLTLQWNHSKRKHAIVQKTLTPQNYVVVFLTAPTAEEAIAYLKAGIVFIPLSDLPSYILYARLAKAGLGVSFQLHYLDEKDGKTILTLGPYVAPDEEREISRIG